MGSRLHTFQVIMLEKVWQMTFLYNGDRVCCRAVHLIGNHETEKARPEPGNSITFKDYP